MPLDSSFFVSDAPVMKLVKMSDGKEYTLYFKELPMLEFTAFNEARQSDDDETRRGAVAKLISMSVFETSEQAPGTFVQSLTYEQALRLRRDPANSFMKAILEINGFGAEEKKE